MGRRHRAWRLKAASSRSDISDDPSAHFPEGLKGPIAAHFETVEKIRRAFEKPGIEFMGYSNPVVRLRTPAE